MTFLKSLKFLPLITIIGCSTSRELVEVSYDEIEVEANSSDIIPYQASNTKLIDVIHTDLWVDFIWEKSQMKGKADITLKAYNKPQNNIELDAKGMEIYKVSVNNRPIDNYTYDSLHINIPYALTKQDTLVVSIEYLAKPNELVTEGSAAITDEKGLYFINPMGYDKNKMPQIWTQGETEATSCWMPTNDSPNEKMTHQIYMRVDSALNTLSNGDLISKSNNEDGTVTYQWYQKQVHAPYLAMMAVGDFQLVEDGEYHGKKIAYLVEPSWKNEAKAIFGNTPEMIQFFSEKLGVEYPWDKYYQIVVRDYVSGAMENTSATLHGEFLYQTKQELIDDNNDAIIAHELFHHWFGDLVTCESWSNLPLNESFANYSEYLWDEHKYGKNKADYTAWDEMQGYLDEYHNGKSVDLIRYRYKKETDMFDSHSYNKGGRILHMLRNYLGDDTFFNGLKIYLNNRAFNTAEVHDLRMAFEEASGEDLNWFFNQWFLASGHPQFKVSYEIDNDSIEVNINQTQNEDSPIFAVPDLSITLVSDQGKEEHLIPTNLYNPERNVSVKFALPSNFKTVVFDANRVHLMEVEEEKSADMWAEQFYATDNYQVKSEALDACLNYADNPKCLKVVEDALQDEFWGIRELAVSWLEIENISNPEKVKNTLRDIIAKDENSTVRNEAILMYQALYGGDKLMDDLLWNKLETDSSFLVQGSALQYVYKKDKEKAQSWIEKNNDVYSSKLTAAIAKVYSTETNAELNQFYLSKRHEVGMYEFYPFYEAYLDYVVVNNVEVADQSLNVFIDLVVNYESDWQIMMGYSGIYVIFDKYSKEFEELNKKFEKAPENSNLKTELQEELIQVATIAEKSRSIFVELSKKETNKKVLKQLGM